MPHSLVSARFVRRCCLRRSKGSLSCRHKALSGELRPGTQRVVRGLLLGMSKSPFFICIWLFDRLQAASKAPQHVDGDFAGRHAEGRNYKVEKQQPQKPSE